MLVTSINYKLQSQNKKTATSFKSLEQNKFNNIFPVFLENTDEKQKMIDSIEPTFLKLQNIDNLRNKKTIIITDIGCGDGFTAFKFFEMTKKIFPKANFKVKALDNNPQQLSAYANRFLDDRRIFVETQNADIFSKGLANSAEKSDITIASHSLYHASPQKLDIIIPSIYDSIDKEGIAIISLLKDNSDFSTIQEKFGEYVSKEGETNPVSVKLADIKNTIKSNHEMAANSKSVPYNSYVYFSRGIENFETFSNWQINNPKIKAPNSYCKKMLDLLEFTVHGDFDKLRKNDQLSNFLETVKKMFIKNGVDRVGNSRINYNGENILLFGKKLIKK